VQLGQQGDNNNEGTAMTGTGDGDNNGPMLKRGLMSSRFLYKVILSPQRR